MSVTAETFAWQDFAICRSLPRELHFGPAGEKDHEKTEREAAAKAVCAGCPVDRECLEDAVTNNIKHGVFGGMSEDERRAYRINLNRRMRAEARAS